MGMYVEYFAGNPLSKEIIYHDVMERVIGECGWQLEDWEKYNCAVVFRYRIRKPLGLTILQRIAADPQPVKEDA